MPRRRGTRHFKKGRPVLCKPARVKYRFTRDHQIQYPVQTTCGTTKSRLCAVIKHLVSFMGDLPSLHRISCKESLALTILTRLGSPTSEDHIKNSINFNEPIAVKDYPEQTISNQNSKQIALLSNQDLDTISSILRSNEHLLDYFGYA